MSPAIDARTVLDFALLQSAAECYLDGLDTLSDIDAIHRKLREGANNALLQDKSVDDPLLAGATRFSVEQAKWFTTHYEIVTNYPNDSSGFSATLFRNRDTGEYTLSFRSTEYQFQAQGGRYERDGSDATDGDISEHGYALAQLSSMENFPPRRRRGGLSRHPASGMVKGSAVRRAIRQAGKPQMTLRPRRSGHRANAQIRPRFLARSGPKPPQGAPSISSAAARMTAQK
jgi:hypothetical protein